MIGKENVTQRLEELKSEIRRLSSVERWLADNPYAERADESTAGLWVNRYKSGRPLLARQVHTPFCTCSELEKIDYPQPASGIPFRVRVGDRVPNSRGYRRLTS